MVVDADVGFDVAQIIISSIVSHRDRPHTDTGRGEFGVYDNLFFSNGNPSLSLRSLPLTR